MGSIVGREDEISILKDALNSKKSELIVLYGRRRIGKTFLVEEVYKKNMLFQFTGTYKVPLKTQLLSFHENMRTYSKKYKKPTSWIEALYQLNDYILKKKTKSKKVIFIDEFPWIDTRKSNFLKAFENFWNGHASKHKDIVIVVCGSAASYMINKIIKSKGGLHNRLTKRIYLKPFTLYETRKLFLTNGVRLSDYDILQLYMVFGGVPKYLEKIKKGESVAQIIDRICFKKNAFLRGEFTNVFASLFEQDENHEAVVRALADVRKGMTRNEILKKTKITTGGRLSKTLVELEESGFIENYTPYSGKKNSLFRLTDEYSLFYIKFIESTKPTNTGVWKKLYSAQAYKIWSGFSFETICIKHVDQIKEALKISGIHSTHGSWVNRQAHEGAQIDLLIDRDDNVINICEMKFYNGKFSINKKYSENLLEKQNQFIRKTRTNKNIHLSFISTYGLKENIYSRQLVQNTFDSSILFRKL